jgi:hypothetical protein
MYFSDAASIKDVKSNFKKLFSHKSTIFTLLAQGKRDGTVRAMENPAP